MSDHLTTDCHVAVDGFANAISMHGFSWHGRHHDADDAECYGIRASGSSRPAAGG
jgi:hypothetical protein